MTTRRLRLRFAKSAAKSLIVVDRAYDVALLSYSAVGRLFVFAGEALIRLEAVVLEELKRDVL